MRLKCTRVFCPCAFFLFFLSGCTSVSIPTKLGIAESEWAGLHKDKQQILLSNYEKFTKERNELTKNKKNSVFLEVAIHSGQVMMAPFDNLQDYKPVKFIIFKGQCRNIILQHPTDKKRHAELGVCFCRDILYLDPSRYDLAKKHGSISINFSPLWLSGFSYKEINSSGYARLNNATIEIMQQEKAAEERT